MTEAATFVVSGTHGWLDLIAVIAFGIATVAAVLTDQPRFVKAWSVCVPLGLCLWALSALWH
jgi:hypothetical protein